MSLEQSASTNRTERKKEDTRQKIISLALKLFRQQGFATTTMEQIATEADIAKGTLYHYFPVKEAILDEYIRRSFAEQNSARVERIKQLSNTRARMEQVFNELLSGIQAQKDIFEKYLIYRMQHWISFDLEENEKSGFQWLAAEIVRLGQEDGDLRSDLPTGTLEDLCEYVFMLAVKEFYLAPEYFNEQQAIERCGDIFINGAGARPHGV
jgi:AcrR family transcriptional regulator